MTYGTGPDLVTLDFDPDDLIQDKGPAAAVGVRRIGSRGQHP